MRMIVVKQPGDLQALAGRLLRPGLAREAASLDALRRLNPHVDFSKLDAGTVLLVPDHPDFDGGDASSIGGEAFDSLAKDALAGLEAAAARMRDGFERRDAQRKDVTGVLRSAAFKRLAEADESLRRQAGEVDSRFKADAKRASDTAATLAAMHKALQAELDALARRVG